MALTECKAVVDQNGYELVEHGTIQFPVACYHDDLGRLEVPWHWHEELEAAIVTEGRATLAVGSEKHTICAGEGFFINRGVLHGAWQAGTDGCRFHSLVFQARLVGGSVDSVFHQKYVQPLMANPALGSILFSPEDPVQKEILECIESAWQACVQEAPGYEFAVRSSLSNVILRLQPYLPVVAQKPAAKNMRDGERIKTMLSFIHENYARELNDSRIAACAAISESECLRCFKATVGVTPIRYLRCYRIQRAAELLTGTEESVADIAAACGFQDVSHFTKTFRQMKGCTPTVWRKTKNSPK